MWRRMKKIKEKCFSVTQIHVLTRNRNVYIFVKLQHFSNKKVNNKITFSIIINDCLKTQTDDSAQPATEKLVLIKLLQIIYVDQFVQKIRQIQFFCFNSTDECASLLLEA